jgi:flagellar protein FliS
MVMSTPALRARYIGDSVSTASPGRLLVMLYERLVLDLAQAEGALRDRDREATNRHLVHAQDIIMELRATLDLTAWEGAGRLANIYTFLLSELMAANVTADAARVTACRALVEPLLDAWRQAALAAAESGGIS